MPPDWLTLGLMVVLIGVPVALALSHWERIRDTGVRKALGLTGMRSLPPGVTVDVRRSTGDDTRQSQIEVRVRGAIPRGLGLSREGVAAKLGKLITGDDVLTGDEAFDRAVHVRGDPVVARAALTYGARKKVRSLLRTFDARVVRGEVRARFPETVSSLRKARGTVRAMVAVADALACDPSDAPTLLSETVRRDPAIPVRRAVLRLLLDRFPDEPSTEVAVRAAADAPDPVLRGLSARHLGTHPGAEALEGLLAMPLPESRVLGLELIEELADPEGAPLAVAALEDADEAVCATAARALARVGSLDHVTALLPHTKGIGAGRALRRAAREAVDSIQARDAAGEPGALSLAVIADAEGAVSLVPDATEGAVSLVDEPVVDDD